MYVCVYVQYSPHVLITLILICADECLKYPALVPIPTPIYVPVPVMCQVPYPVPLPFPLPIPVPIFVPTTQKTFKALTTKIKVSGSRAK